MLLCQECDASIHPHRDEFSSWQKLYHLFEFLYSQELISGATYENAIDTLMDLKGGAMDAAEEKEDSRIKILNAEIERLQEKIVVLEKINTLVESM